ncbi:hypothetical protein K788_00021850 (plasmid) [Paraburkholderia caribensis MBA4]|uniref:Uncharacterized protein n=1 Tax=Paraburkholderia caribensis MBA4 TaxID=1323664 RepID=A0A0P0RP28_9BURK|nr:hypothetical protein K788_00021850 [Paraburkholderia caribensis MBA4]
MYGKISGLQMYIASGPCQTIKFAVRKTSKQGNHSYIVYREHMKCGNMANI